MRFLTHLLIVVFIITAYPLNHFQLFANQYPAWGSFIYTSNNRLDNSNAEQCRFLSEPEVLRDEPGLMLQKWIETRRPALTSLILPETASFHEFRDSINQLLNTDPLVLLNSQRSQVTGGDAINIYLALEGEAGTIRKINCLEGLLLSVQTERSVSQGKSMYSDPTEFMSFVLSKGDSLKIYFYTVDQPGIGGLSVFDELLDRDLADGWKVTRNIHNHNFFPGSEMVLGGVVPSAADVGAFRHAAGRYGLSGATITNGFDSIDLTPEDFLKFSTGSP